MWWHMKSVKGKTKNLQTQVEGSYKQTRYSKEFLALIVTYCGCLFGQPCGHIPFDLVKKAFRKSKVNIIQPLEWEILSLDRNVFEFNLAESV